MSDNTRSGQEGFHRVHCIAILSVGLSVLAVTGFVLWMNFRPINPICTIEDLTIYKIRNSTNTTIPNPGVFIDLNLKNVEHDNGICYDAFTLTLYQAPNFTTPAGFGTYPSFCQKNMDNTHLFVDAHWLALTEEVLNGSGTVLRIELEIALRFKVQWWKTKRHHLTLGAAVKLNGFGQKVGPNSITLTSAAPKERGCYPAAGVMFCLCIVWVILLRLQ